MDALCQQLDMDPLEFRKRNASVTGSPMPHRNAVPLHRPDHHPRSGRHASLLDRSAPAGPLSARPRPGTRLLAWHVDDLGRAHHHRRRRPPDGDDGRRRHIRRAQHHGPGGCRGIRPAPRRRPCPHRRYQIGRLQRCRRRQPRRAHQHGRACGGQPRCAEPAAGARRREAAMSHRSNSTMRKGVSACRVAARPSRSRS